MSNSRYNPNHQWSSSQYSAQPQLQLENEFDFMPGSGSSQQQYPQQHSAPLSQNPVISSQFSQHLPNQYTATSNNNYASGNQQSQTRRSYGDAPHGTTRTGAPQMNSFAANQGYGGTIPPQQTTFNPDLSYFNKPPSQSFSSNPPLPYRPQFSQSQDAAASPGNLHIDDGGLTPPHVPSVHVNFQQTQMHPPHYFQSHDAHIHTSKRARATDEADESKDDFGNGDQDSEQVESPTQKDSSAKMKGQGACSRCKSLKVRCEFKTDTDPCKRCMNGGHECFIPGRKKRRTPPKREHLLSQIRDQAAQIKALMSQLEAMNLQASRSSTSARGHTPSSPADLHSPVLDPNALPDAAPARPEVQDWISKARESIDAFGGFIGVGGTGMTKSLLVKEDPEDSESSEGDVEFAVEEDSDGDDEYLTPNEDDTGHLLPPHPGGYRRNRSAERESVSSAGTNAGFKKKDLGGVATQKLVTIPTGASPFGLIANLALKKNRRRRSSGSGVEDDVGVANEDFFRPSPGPDPMRGRLPTEERQHPHILTRDIVTPEEAEKLFKIYFDYMNMSLSLLDPVLYTAQQTCWRSPFLFTVVCAIASRYYSEKPELYSQIMHYAQLAAGTALISGQKSVDVCHAYILLSLYPVPARRWEEDRSWIYLGLAIRVATDLNLHHPNTAKPLNEQHAREMLNRTRVWLNCFNLDRSMGSQYGKAPIIKNTDYMADRSGDWWNSSDYNISNLDIHLCAYNAELRVMGRFVGRIYSDPNHPTGLNKEVDFERVATETDDELVRLGEQWFACLDKTDQTDPQNCFRIGLLRLAYSYARLIALSFGFQHAFGKNNTNENPFLLRCLRAASDVVNTVVDDVGRPSQRIFLRHGPEAQSVFVTFASAFLVKLLQPKFSSYLTTDQRLEIRGLVQKVVDLLGSPEVAIDDRHGPKLYSRFLKGLLATPMARVDISPGGLKNSPPLPRKSRKAKSGSGNTPDSEHGFDFGVASSSNQPSPSTTVSLSPPPSMAGISFDQFAPVDTGVDPFATQPHIAMGGNAPMDPMQDPLEMNMSDFFQPPLPFDNELLASMQALTNDPVWHDMAIPGFNWMSQMQSPDIDINMKGADPAMFHPAQQQYHS